MADLEPLYDNNVLPPVKHLRTRDQLSATATHFATFIGNLKESSHMSIKFTQNIYSSIIYFYKYLRAMHACKERNIIEGEL